MNDAQQRLDNRPMKEKQISIRTETARCCLLLKNDIMQSVKTYKKIAKSPLRKISHRISIILLFLVFVLDDLE